MLRLRPFAPEDAGAVAALHARVYPDSGWDSQAACASYLSEMLFHNPWRDPQLPSWVAEDADGVVGFLGVLPRRMLFGSRAIRVAVGCQFMVAPEKRNSFTALELLRRFFSGPQELSVADGANDASRRLWEAAGGMASPLHALTWMRLLRPAGGLWQLAGGARRGRTLGALAAPLAAAADGCLGRIALPRLGTELTEEPLDAGSLLAALEAERGVFALRPHYDLGALEWLLAQARAKRRHGELQGCLLRERRGAIAGWFLYYLNRTVSQVLQLGARRDRGQAVLKRLCHHAWQRGAVAIEGRVEPHLAGALHGSRCLILSRPISTLLHAREPALLVPFLRGDAFFTRLEGEWWMRFAGEPAAAPAPQRGVYDRLHQICTLVPSSIARLAGMPK